MRLAMLTLAAITLLTLVSVTDVSAQGRGKGRDRGSSMWGKKCDKFVNCHDARDGRWDGRGPSRRSQMRNRYYSPYESTRIYGGRRMRRVYNDGVYVRSRRRW